MQNGKSVIFKNAVALALLAGMGFSQQTLADTQLNITGTIKASPCVVNGDSGGSIDVDLGTHIQASTLAAASSASDWKAFNLTLSNCPLTTNNVTATFSGLPATESATLYKNTGNATKVQVELQDAANNNLGNGKTMTQPVSHTTNTAVFGLKARVYSRQGGATPGSIVGTVQVAFIYL
jgi:minor fimbrial subunit